MNKDTGNWETMPHISSWRGEPSVKGSTESVRMALLTATLVGLQFTWGLEMTYCTPYLLQLGLTKSKISLVWIAGPLSGLIMQPIIGVIADRSTHPWGRRRPFMVFGSIIVAGCLLVLGRTKEVVEYFMGTGPENAAARKSVTIDLAVLSIYAIDFAINAVQGSARSLIVDTLPIPKQQLGSAWASRMVAVGHLLGYALGAVNLNSIFGTSLGDTQFKQLTALAAIGLLAAVSVTCWAVTERVLISDGRDAHGEIGAVQTITKIVTTARNLPPRIAGICLIQFCAWFGWFPFLFYTTTWVGEIYLRYDAKGAIIQSDDALGQMGRVGSTALIVFSVITFVGSVVLPWFIKSPEDEQPAFTPRPPEGIASILFEIEKCKPELLTAWRTTHLIFACAMASAPFVGSVRAATFVVAACGVPWALQVWAPFTFMGVEINRLGHAAAHQEKHGRRPRDSNELEASRELKLGDESLTSSSKGTSGVYLGILNISQTIPQFIGTFICWVVFSLLEPGKSPELAKDAHPDEQHSTDGPNAIGVCLFLGSISATAASFATRRLQKMAK